MTISKARNTLTELQCELMNTDGTRWAEAIEAIEVILNYLHDSEVKDEL